MSLTWHNLGRNGAPGKLGMLALSREHLALHYGCTGVTLPSSLVPGQRWIMDAGLRHGVAKSSLYKC